MAGLRNFFALIGFVIVVAIIAAAVRYSYVFSSLRDFDSKAASVYLDIGQKLLTTGDIAEATVWKAQVKTGVSAEDVEEAIRLVGNELNIRNVGELPLSRQVELETGKAVRYLKIFQFCDPQTALRMVNHSDAFAAYLPCRISVVEDRQGGLWIYTLNMDMLIHGGKSLPADVQVEAVRIRDAMLAIMSRGAAGDW